MLYSLKTERDGMVLSRLGRLEDALPYTVPGGTAGAISPAYRIASGDATTPGGVINPTDSSGTLVTGSVPPIVADGLFGVTFTDTQIHLYWDGTNSSRVFVIRKPSGINQAVPPGDLLITGLSASTKYGFFPFWPPFNACTIGWAPGISGTPQIAFPPSATSTQLASALQAQSMLSYEPLSSGAFSVTTAAPLGSGTSTAGDTDGCVMLGTDIEPMGEIQPNEWRNVHQPWTEWIRVQTNTGRTVNCVPRHQMYDADSGKVEAQQLHTGRWTITEQGEERITELTHFSRVCTKVQTFMNRGHLYFANGFLSHNLKNPGSFR